MAAWGGVARAAAVMPLTPEPRLGEWLAGAGSATPFTVERWGKVGGREAKSLVRAFTSRLPRGRLPAEGYLLGVGEAGAVAVVADDLGEIRAKQTMRQLPQAAGECPRLRIADWPDMAWRGLHVLDSGPRTLPAIKRLIHEVLAARKCNYLVYEIDYNFQFVSHPEVGSKEGWSSSEIGELVQACREEGIKVFPEINCLGHQTWGEQISGGLLGSHPELLEAPDGRIPQTRTGSGDFYCHSWCPSNPDTNRIVLDLIDELTEAFQSDSFHVGMDEVFVVASENCPRCRGKDPAKLFARQVNDFHEHLTKRGKKMFMWGDRLLDGKATGYGDWDASTNGTAPAIKKVPRDIVICDWHYDPLDDYPSLRVFTRAGFRVWPTVYSSLDGTRQFMSAARARKDKRILGVLTSIWIPAERMAAATLGIGAPPDESTRRISGTAVTGLTEAWTGPVKEEIALSPAEGDFLGSMEVTMKPAKRGGVIRYTLDGGAPTASSTKYASPVRLTDSSVVTAAVCRDDAVSMHTVTGRFVRLTLKEPANPRGLVPGVEYAVYINDGPEWENMPDFSELKQVKRGVTEYIDLALAPRQEKYGMAFTCFLDAPAEGKYTFTLGSDDGSLLLIGGEKVVDNDGQHSMVEKSGDIALRAGKHPITVQFFQGTENAELALYWEGPGIVKQKVPAGALWRKDR